MKVGRALLHFLRADVAATAIGPTLALIVAAQAQTKYPVTGSASIWGVSRPISPRGGAAHE
jgi:hypothetical protein